MAKPVLRHRLVVSYQAGMDGVDVRIAKPGRDRSPARLDHPGPEPDLRPDCLVAADGNDPSIADSERACPAPGRIHGRDATTQDGEVDGTVDGHVAPEV